MSLSLRQMYTTLLNAYGPQGWWPLLHHPGTNPTKTGAVDGYHCNDYRFPEDEAQCFEICLGAILTQNTAWTNVERALHNLEEQQGLTPEGIEKLDDESLLQAIRPSGYYNSKARKLRVFSQFFRELAGAVPTRRQLLDLWGVGPETADAMRLYAFGQVEMVVDTYTRRILSHLGLVTAEISYEDLKAFCVARLPKELIVYQEFHALLVEHAKRCYARKPWKDRLFA